MNWISENREWLFSGLGGAVVMGIAGFLFKRKRDKVELSQSIKTGDNSTNIQGGNDVNVTIGDKK